MQVQINDRFARKDVPLVAPNGVTLLLTPPLDGDYWLLRVPVSEKQSIVAFPKFFTIGIGFQHEDDWNTNLPYSCEAEEIFDHIKHNKLAAGDESIEDATCIEAIRLLQQTVGALKEGPLN